MRLIDADALIKYCDDKWIPLNVDAVNAQPTIEPERTGRWIDRNDNVATCSICGSRWGLYRMLNYCPNCGAEMREDTK